MGQRGHCFTQDQIDLGCHQAGDLGIFGHCFGVRRQHIGPVGRDQRPQRSGDTRARTMGGSRRAGLGKGLRVQGAELVIKAKACQPIMVDGVAVGGGHCCPGRKVVGVHLCHQTGMIAHHLCGPECCGRIARAGQQLLPHSAIQKRDPGHQLIASFAARPPNSIAATLFTAPIRADSDRPR